MNEKRVIRALAGWTELNAVVADMSEEELKAALDIERKHRRRQQIMLRLHRKFCTLRRDRERAELMEVANG